MSFQQFDLPTEEYADFLPDGELLAVPMVVEEKSIDNSGPGGPIPSPSLDFNDNEDIPTELSDSSETHDEGTEPSSVQSNLLLSLSLLQIARLEKLVKTPDSICVALGCLGEVQALHEDLNGRQHINEVYKFSVDKLYDILFTESQFMSDFMEQRRISGQLNTLEEGQYAPLQASLIHFVLLFRRGVPPMEEGGGWQPDQGDHVHHLTVQPPGPQIIHSQ